MLVPVSQLLGLASIPTDRTAAKAWLIRHRVPVSVLAGDGRRPEAVHLSDLPDDIRRAYLERQAEEALLDPGAFDDAAHLALSHKPEKVQARAYENAAKLLFIVKRQNAGATWPQIEEAGKKAFKSFPSRNSMKTWKAKTEGVDPANWAPALAPEWKNDDAGHPVSPEAWEMLCQCVYFGGKNTTGLPLKAAYQIVADQAKAKDWDWPELHTIRRRWNAMDPVERLAHELGEERAEAVLRLRQPQHSRALSAMDIVDGDGREFKVIAQWPDGYVGCPLVVALVDRASRKTVGYAVGKSENADVTETAIMDMCDRHGRPIAITLDNGAAFNSKRIAGGKTPYYRRKQTLARDWEVPGVLAILDIELRNTGVGAKTSNLQENVWSHLRHLDNHPAFHGAVRPGPNDPEAKAGAPVPIELFEQLLDQAVARLNADTENRVQGLSRGESRDTAFERLLKDGVKRVVTPLMRRRLGMVWKRKTVQPDGRIRFDNGYFGDATTQGTMLRYAGKLVLVGFNPLDFSAPAMVCTWEGKGKASRLILAELPAVEPTEHGSEEGRRIALTEKRRINKILSDLRAKYPDSDVDRLRDMIRQDAEFAKPKPGLTRERVVALPGRSPFAPEDAGEAEGVISYLTEERLRNFEEATARRLAERF